MDKLNISPDEKIAGVPLARLLRNLEETSYNEGVMDLACRLTDCKAVIEELLARRAAPSSSADELPPLPEVAHSRLAPDFTADQMREYARAAIKAAAPAAKDDARFRNLLEAARETMQMHDEVTGGNDYYGYISPKLRGAVADIDDVE